jgi:hypothetical protein
MENRRASDCDLAVDEIIATITLIWPGALPRQTLNERYGTQEVTKEVVGIHDLLTRSLFGDGILRALLWPVSLAKPTSTLLLC